MHRKNDDLNNLVDSLSSEEKRYIRRFLGMQGQQDTQPFYLQVFETMLHGKSEINATHQTSPQALVTARRHLYANIQKALRVMYQDASADMQIQNLLADVEILYRRNLPEQGLLCLQKANKLAVRSEQFGLLLQILHWERKLNIILGQATRSAAEIAVEEQAVLSRLDQVMVMEAIYGKAKALKRQYGYVKGQLKEDLARETILATGMPTLEGCKSQQAVYYYNFIHTLYHWMQLDHRAAYNYSKQLLAPGLQGVLPTDYLDGILEHITSCMCLGYFGDALRHVVLAEEYVAEQKFRETHNFHVKLFCYNWGYKLVMFNYMGAYEQLREATDVAETWLQKNARLLSEENLFVTRANLLNAYIGIAAYDKVNQLLRDLFQKKSKTLRLHFYDSLYFFRLFNLIQSGAFEVIPSMAVAAYRHYRKVNDSSGRVEVELPVVRLLVKDYDYEKRSVRNELLTEIKSILEAYVARIKGVNSFQEHYTFYIIWCDALMEELPFWQVARRWYLQFQERIAQPPG
jgi:hypothetical protein